MLLSGFLFFDCVKRAPAPWLWCSAPYPTCQYARHCGSAPASLPAPPTPMLGTVKHFCWSLQDHYDEGIKGWSPNPTQQAQAIFAALLSSAASTFLAHHTTWRWILPPFHHFSLARALSPFPSSPPSFHLSCTYKHLKITHTHTHLLLIQFHPTNSLSNEKSKNRKYINSFFYNFLLQINKFGQESFITFFSK